MKLTKKMLCVGVAFFAGVLLRSASVMAGAKVYVGGKCNHTQHLSLNAADHSAWDTLLRKYVDDGGLVDYAGWKQNAGDMRASHGGAGHFFIKEIASGTSRPRNDERISYD